MTTNEDASNVLLLVTHSVVRCIDNVVYLAKAWMSAGCSSCEV